MRQRTGRNKFSDSGGRVPQKRQAAGLRIIADRLNEMPMLRTLVAGQDCAPIERTQCTVWSLAEHIIGGPPMDGTGNGLTESAKRFNTAAAQHPVTMRIEYPVMRLEKGERVTASVPRQSVADKDRADVTINAPPLIKKESLVTSDATDEARWLTIPEAAERLGVQPFYVNKWVQQGRIPSENGKIREDIAAQYECVVTPPMPRPRIEQRIVTSSDTFIEDWKKPPFAGVSWRDETGEMLWHLWHYYFQDGGWKRLKRCRRCPAWFVDRSKNQSGKWCPGTCKGKFWTRPQRRESKEAKKKGGRKHGTTK